MRRVPELAGKNGGGFPSDPVALFRDFR